MSIYDLTRDELHARYQELVRRYNATPPTAKLYRADNREARAEIKNLLLKTYGENPMTH